MMNKRFVTQAVGLSLLVVCAWAAPAAADDFKGAAKDFRASQKASAWKDRANAYAELHGVQSVCGIDIISAAKAAARRDRPEVYDDYRVTDLTDLPEDEENRSGIPTEG